MKRLTLQSSVAELVGVGATREKQLLKLGVNTIYDLIYLFPLAAFKQNKVSFLSAECSIHDSDFYNFGFVASGRCIAVNYNLTFRRYHNIALNCCCLCSICIRRYFFVKFYEVANTYPVELFIHRFEVVVPFRNQCVFRKKDPIAVRHPHNETVIPIVLFVPELLRSTILPVASKYSAGTVPV